MMEITRATVLRKRSDIRYRRIDGEAVVLRQSTAEVLVLNELAGEILDLVDGKRPIADWIDRLEADYSVERPVLQRDLVEFAGELLEAGLLEEVPAPEVAGAGSGGGNG
jgi:hypothetical protein